MRGDREPKTLLWENLRAAMVARYGEENLNRLASDAKIGLGSASRLKAMKTSIGIDVLAKLAKTYGFEPWQLLLELEEREQFLTVLKAWRYPAGREMLIVASEAVLRRYGGDDH